MEISRNTAIAENGTFFYTELSGFDIIGTYADVLYIESKNDNVIVLNTIYILCA